MNTGVDFLAAEGSKARGLQAALNQLGLTMQDAMALHLGLNGDSGNDAGGGLCGGDGKRPS